MSTKINIVKSPYRICPLGAHVDHQSGLVTGFAIDKGINLAFHARDDGYVCVESADFPDKEVFHLDSVPGMIPGYWGNYLRGAVLALERKHKLRYGIQGVAHGELPIFGGLSSSAAVSTAYLMALAFVNDLDLKKEDLMEHSHWIENRFIGLNNGILDQAANILSLKDYLMVMDCQANHYELYKKPDNVDFEIVIIHSGISKALISTDYNNRVDECKAAAWFLQEVAGIPIKSFRETRIRHIDKVTYENYYDRIPGRFKKRVKHFFDECDRVQRGVEAWKTGDIAGFGKLMNESCESSINNYECGCPELITIFEILKKCDGVYGARFSGAGYRGCCIGLINGKYKDEIRKAIDKVYPNEHPGFADSYRIEFCKMDDGARLYESDNTSSGICNKAIPAYNEYAQALA